jgi:ABC-type lipoprotein export system ATPase subunit
MSGGHYATGSVWRRWDLHVHTPASFLHGYPGPDPWDAFLTDLASLPPEMSVLGINDYLFVDGYRRVLGEMAAGNLPNLEALFPVIELRIDQLVGTEGHLNRINLHTIFEPGLSPDVVEAQFVNGLSASFRLDAERPDKISWSGFPSLQALAQLGTEIRASMPPERAAQHSEGDVELGFNNLVLSLESVRTRLEDPLFRSRALTAVGKTEWASLAWNDRSIARKKDVINGADAVFVAAENPGAYGPARDALRNAAVNTRLLDCSDAHHLSTSDHKDRVGNCLTWINADPTLEGLRHALTEFDHRVYVGIEPPKLSAIRLHPGDHIRSVAITKRATDDDEAHGFFDIAIDLNPGFVSVVGNKGNGKSALLDAIGLAGNSSREPHFTFLNGDRFRNPLANRALSYEVKLEWCSGELTTTALSQPVVPLQPERVTYLPQRLIDSICSSDPGEPSQRFASELSAVLFAHVPDADRLGASDLDSLVKLRSEAIEEQLTVLRGELATMNRAIVALEREIRPDRRGSLESQLKALQRSLADLEAVEPEVPALPSVENDQTLDPLRARISSLEEARTVLQRQQAAALAEDGRLAIELDRGTQLATGIETLRQQLTTFRSTYREHAAALGLEIDELVRVEMNLSGLDEVTSSRRSRRSEIGAVLDPEHPDSVAAEIVRIGHQIADLESELDQPSREYAQRLRDRQLWEHSRLEVLQGSPDGLGIKSLSATLEELDQIPRQLDEMRKRRDAKTHEIHTALRAQVEISEDLYGPARRFIADHPLASKCDLEFGAELRERLFAQRFFEIVGRNVSGTFFGVDEGASALREMLRRTDLNDTDSVIAFANEIDSALHQDRRRDPQPVDVDRAIRSAHSLEELYDLVFGLSYLEPYYHLASEGVAIDRLSPGQKGTLLLMFYLLVDPSRRPLLLDQPDENLDNGTIKDLLVPAIKEARERRQVIVVTHNPNVAVVADADQVITASFDGTRFTYMSGSIEDPPTNAEVVDVLEGTWPAFENRERKYQSPRA